MKNGRHSRRGARKGRSKNPGKTDTILQEILDINKQQTIRGSPVKKDQAPMVQGVRDKMYTFWQTYVGPQINSSASLEVDGAIAPILTSFSNAASLVTCFDAYRIIQITVKFYPVATPASTGASGPLYTAIDFDDTATTLLNTIVSYDTLYVTQVGVYFERTFQPRVAKAVYSGAFTSFGQEKSPWIDCNSNTVVHYGLKYALPNGTVATNLWDTTVSAVIQFKNVR